MTARRPRAPADPQALLAFALRHLRVTNFPGSVQRTEAGSYVLEERTVSDHNLIYVTRGTALWVIDGVDHRLDEGALVIVPPGAPHSGRSVTKAMTLGSIHVIADLPGGQDLFALLAPPRLRMVAAGSRLDELFRAAMAEYARGFAEASTMIPHWAPLVVKELLRHDAAAGRLEVRGADPVVTAILEWLERHLAQPVALPELAARAGYTPQHLNRRFTREIGMTPLVCLAGMRMERAVALLREGRLSVQAVGEQVGCADPAYFSRLFRKHFGRSPSEYQRLSGSDSPS